MASTIIFGAALAVSLGGAAQAQGTATAQQGNAQTETTENAGQGQASTRVVGNSQGQNAPGGGAQVGEVVVTGSRIARRDYVAASPIVSVGPKALEATGSVTVETLINQLPAFTPSVTSTSNNPSNGGQANIDLRGLGTNRTLVLVDGRRVTPSNADGTVDVNTIPAALIENIEIVTGGQSAAYGSDAIAGVVNFKLKKNFQGLVIDSQYGITERGDAQEETVSATIGGNFNEDRGNAVVSFSYANRDSIYNGSRAFSAISGPSGTTPYGAIDFGAARPTQAAVNAVFGKYGVAAGAVPNSSRLGFNNNGTLFAQRAGGANYLGDKTSPDFATIPVTGTYNTGAINLLQIPLTRYNAFARAEYRITPHAKAYLQASFTNYTADTQLAPSPAASSPAAGGTGFLVPVQNPFIPADLATLLASRTDPGAPFVIRDRFTAVGPRVSSTEYNVYQLLTGVSGDLPALDWTYDVYGSYGRVTLNEIQSGNISHSAVRTLLEAPDGGASLCTGGYNIFGLQQISDSCKAYVSRQSKNFTAIEQRVVEANVQGSLFELPAGKLKFALGADYRSDEFVLTPDSLLASTDLSANVINGRTLVNNTAGVIGFNASNPLSGSTDVYELYGEVLIPVVRDLPFAKSIDVTAGYRFSQYNTAGNVNSYRVDGNWRIIDALRIRGGYSRSVRAPSIGELFSPPNNNFPTIGAAGSRTGDPCDVDGYRKSNTSAALRALCIATGVPASIADSFTESNTQVQTTVSGNPNLSAESADTYTIGAVFSPRFNNPLFSRLSASIDYYNIEVTSAIGPPDALLTLQKCYNVDGSNPTYSAANPFCGLITRDSPALSGAGASGSIVDMDQTLSNVQGFRTSGIDFQVDWAFGLGAIGLSDSYGSLAFNGIGTYLREFQVQSLTGAPFDEFKGTIGNTAISLVDVAHPEWRVLTGLTYSYGPVDLGFRWRYIAGMDDASGDGTTAAAVNYFDANVRWKLNDIFEVRAGVNNFTDEQPSIGFTSVVQANTDPSTYDVFGRRYYVALKARF